MIQKLNERVASIAKALREETTKAKHTKNALTRLNNEIVRVEVKDILSDEGGIGYDN